jgi:hypothetical protein
MMVKNAARLSHRRPCLLKLRFVNSIAVGMRAWHQCDATLSTLNSATMSRELP